MSDGRPGKMVERDVVRFLNMVSALFTSYLAVSPTNIMGGSEE